MNSISARQIQNDHFVPIWQIDGRFRPTMMQQGISVSLPKVYKPFQIGPLAPRVSPLLLCFQYFAIESVGFRIASDCFPSRGK